MADSHLTPQTLVGLYQDFLVCWEVFDDLSNRELFFIRPIRSSLVSNEGSTAKTGPAFPSSGNTEPTGYRSCSFMAKHLTQATHFGVTIRFKDNLAPAWSGQDLFNGDVSSPSTSSFVFKSRSTTLLKVR